MSLADAIVEATGYFSVPPPNESNTCEWVILPLLWASGYARHQIHSRVFDRNGQYPDYTILPEASEHTWYLEAKAWNVELEDQHAQQSLNYANQNGKRWVVLTNGRLWRLYDNDIRGIASNKLVTEAHLDDAEAIQPFLTALGREAVLSIGIEAFAEESQRLRQEREEAARQQRERQARHSLLHSVLRTQLADTNSPVVRSIRSVLESINGLEAISAEEIIEYFGNSQPAENTVVQAVSIPIPIEDRSSPAPKSARLDFWKQFFPKAETAGLSLDGNLLSRTEQDSFYLPLQRCPGKYWFCYYLGEKHVTLEFGLMCNEATRDCIERLWTSQERIEQEIGFPLKWRSTPKRGDRCIDLIIEGGFRSSREKWPSLHDEMIAEMVRFRRFFEPYISTLD